MSEDEVKKLPPSEKMDEGRKLYPGPDFKLWLKQLLLEANALKESSMSPRVYDSKLIVMFHISTCKDLTILILFIFIRITTLIFISTWL